MKKKLEFSVKLPPIPQPPPFRVCLPILKFRPNCKSIRRPTDPGNINRFDPRVNGDGDGVTGFAEIFDSVSRLPNGNFSSWHFPQGMKGEMNFDEQIRRLLGRGQFADPNLVFSLHEEDSQATLLFLRHQFGVEGFIALRRLLCRQNGKRYALGVFYERRLNKWQLNLVCEGVPYGSYCRVLCL